MQATLLGFAIALILALIAALIGPHFVDWNAHRAVLEAKASQLIGLKVHVAGDIDARILPFPSVTLSDIAIGPGAGDSRLRARSLRIELALGALMRGEVRAVEMRLVKPDFSLGLDGEGRIDWPAVALAPETLSIDRLSIEDGRATLSDARSQSKLTLEQLWFNGEVRSLTGPFRGKGEFVASGGAYGYSVNAGRHGPDGIRLRLGLETAERPLTVEAEGLLAFERAAPRFDGALRLSRPASSVLASGRAVAHEPWRLTGRIVMGADAARLEEISFHYGPAERATALAGSGEFVYGAEPRLNAELTARQIDIDRMLATPDAPRRLPFSAVRAFGELVGGALRPPWPLRLAVRTDVATLGGAPLQAVAADLRSDGKDWHLERLEFRAPGFTQVRLSGKLYPVGAGLGFAGDANVDSGDSRLLMAWIAGQAGTAGPVKPWQAKGTVILGADRIAVERLQTEFGHGPIEGRVGYSWPAGNRAARLDAELKAAELDFDAVLGFGEAALPGLGLERPREAALAIEIGRARVAGFEARNLTARLKIDGAGVAIERVSIADFGNAGVEVRGRIAAEPSAGDNITADLDARELNGVLALTERYLPALAAPLRRLAGAQGSAKLRAVVSRERAAAGLANARVDLTGRIGALRVNLLASAEGTSEALSMTDLPALADAELRLGGQFDADDGGALLAALGLERLAELGRRPGRLVVTANGPLNRALRFDGKLSAGPIDAEGEGAVRLQADRPTSIAIERFIGAVGGHKVSGRLAVQLGETAQLDGAIEAETLDASATIAAAIGLPPRSGDAKGWSPEPFPMVRSDWTGQIAFKARRAAFPGALEAEDLRGVARLTRSGIMFEDVKAAFAKGRFDGRLEVSGETGGLSARARLALSNADAALLFGTGDPPPVAGRLSLRAEVAGSGRSPAAFIGSLSGSGNVALEDARLAGLNPGVFDAVIRAAELGLPLEGRRVAPFVEGMLGSGALAVTRAEAAVGISAGQARLSEVAVQAPAEVMAAASLDLATGTLDALVTLTGQPALSGGARPAVQVALKGAFAAPQRSFDVSSLANWLTMRAVEQQSKQLDVIERQNLERKEEPPKPRTDAPQPVTDRASAEPAPPLPPPVSIPAPPAARPTSSPNAVVRPPGLIGAQN